MTNNGEVFHKLYEYMLKIVDTGTCMWDEMPPMDDDMSMQLIKDSREYAMYCIWHHTSLDVAKAAIDRLTDKGELNSAVLTDAINSGDPMRVEYVLNKGVVYVDERNMRDAIFNNDVSIVQYLIDTGHSNLIVPDTKNGMYEPMCIGRKMADILYGVGVHIIPIDFQNSIKNRKMFLWLYNKSPETCDPETKAKAIEKGWITE
jgi:hypothetical protein